MIYDISQPLFECEVFPGDPEPEKVVLNSIENGDSYNLSAIKMCAHNGTHIDAPLHFIKNGKGVGSIPLEKFIGPAFVSEFSGDLNAQDALKLLERAGSSFKGAEKKILIKGRATVTAEAAEVFAASGADLVGNESQTVGPEDSPMQVHLILLGAEVVLLEGIRLSSVPDGAYYLNCAPLNLTDTDGAPCRAVLTDINSY